MFSIRITSKTGEQQNVRFSQGEVTIGRVQGNDIILNKSNVSKKHAKILCENGTFVVVDLKSTNGTYVNGQRITAPYDVGRSDRVFVGDYVLEVVPETAPKPAAPPPPPSKQTVVLGAPTEEVVSDDAWGSDVAIDGEWSDDWDPSSGVGDEDGLLAVEEKAPAPPTERMAIAHRAAEPRVPEPPVENAESADVGAFESAQPTDLFDVSDVDLEPDVDAVDGIPALTLSDETVPYGEPIEEAPTSRIMAVEPPPKRGSKPTAPAVAIAVRASPDIPEGVRGAALWLCSELGRDELFLRRGRAVDEALRSVLTRRPADVSPDSAAKAVALLEQELSALGPLAQALATHDRAVVTDDRVNAVPGGRSQGLSCKDSPRLWWRLVSGAQEAHGTVYLEDIRVTAVQDDLGGLWLCGQRRAVADRPLVELVADDSLSSEASTCLRRAVETSRNIWIVGTPHEGRSQLLAALIDAVPSAELMAVVESHCVLAPRHEGVLRLSSAANDAAVRLRLAQVDRVALDVPLATVELVAQACAPGGALVALPHRFLDDVVASARLWGIRVDVAVRVAKAQAAWHVDQICQLTWTDPERPQVIPLFECDPAKKALVATGHAPTF